MLSRRPLLVLASLGTLAGCGAAAHARPVAPTAGKQEHVDSRPTRFTIRPDDYHVPYAGTAADGRRFFLSDELFSDDRGWVGLFLWTADGVFDEVRVSAVGRATGVPPGQAAPAPSDRTLQDRLHELGKFVLEPITVEPFTRTVDGTEFGWEVGRYDDGSYYISIEPGDFIAYSSPWDGYEYDT
ncbi:hypothetical protein D9V37_07995 [Nocardioides mangrovicus]|uniref:Uncharacterized protein n=2 Tax=Nocardioides mangrovicus TaxID=2478913 RepID=A0A3L8P3Z2_9ACTN|nr:hypothetical protein D9V37_07995 [Nocardioides mangrovicus]